jgi:hypothetical protein
MDSKGWVLLSVGAVVGVGLCLVSTAVRDAVLDAVDAVIVWWWDLVYAVRRFFMWCGLLVLSGLSMWAVVALLLPRLTTK